MFGAYPRASVVAVWGGEERRGHVVREAGGMGGQHHVGALGCGKDFSVYCEIE
jgi:hypothetical protein